MNKIIALFIPPASSTTTINNYYLPQIQNINLKAFEIKLKTNNNIVFCSFDEPQNWNKRLLVMNNTVEKYAAILSDGTSDAHIDIYKDSTSANDDYNNNTIKIRLLQIDATNDIIPFVEHSGVFLEFYYK